MHKKIINCIGVLILSLALFGCKKERPLQTGHTHGELQKALEGLGYTFDNNELVINDKVLKTTSLDLNNKGITSLTGIELFPALTELILDGNKMEKLGGEEFKPIVKSPLTKLSMRNCDISELDISSLKQVEEFYLDGSNTFEHIRGLETDARQGLKIIHLPASVKWNRDEVLALYNQKSPERTMKIEIDGKLTDYTSIRAVPDEVFRGFLKKKYPEVFTDDNKLDLNKKPDITPENEKEKTTWKTGRFDSFFFDASGIKNLDGLQFFKSRAIKVWHIYNAEFESIDLSNDDVLESFRIGANKSSELEIKITTNTKIKDIKISNCKNLKNLIFEGSIDKIDLSGNIVLEDLVVGKAIQTLDLSDCNSIMRISATSSLSENEPGKLTKITFPTSNEWKGARMLDLSNTLISDIDFAKLKADDFFGVTLALEKCPNLKVLKVALKLGNGTTFNNGHFESVDLRGSTVWNVGEKKWLPADNIKSLYKDNARLKTLNGKPYQLQENYPDYVKTIVVDASDLLKWTYLHFDQNGELKTKGIDTYPSADPSQSGQDAQWLERSDWDFALHYRDLRTNAKGGIYNTKQGSFEEVTAEKAAKFDYVKNSKWNLNMILSLDNMPPPRASVLMSKEPIFMQRGGMPPVFEPTGTIFALKRADGKYALLKFTNFYDQKNTAGFVEIKYALAR